VLRPRLDGRRRFIGPVGMPEKLALLGGARAVLIPSTAPETSSLVAMEALACGTPVIAYRSGALPEIVDDGVTGFLVDGVDGLVGAMRRIDRIDRAACRRAAEERFDVRRMTAQYLALYAATISACAGS
jgi:glycosyltransferase involved in cell wall biosynthesis